MFNCGDSWICRPLDVHDYESASRLSRSN